MAVCSINELIKASYLFEAFFVDALHLRERETDSQSCNQAQHTVDRKHSSSAHLLLGPAVLRQLLLLLPLVPPLRSPHLFQGGRGFLFRWRVVCELPAAYLSVIQPAFP